MMISLLMIEYDILVMIDDYIDWLMMMIDDDWLMILIDDEWTMMIDWR